MGVVRYPDDEKSTPSGDDSQRLWFATMVEVLRDEMAARKVRITELSRSLGRGPAYLNNALRSKPEGTPSLRVATLVAVLRALEISEVEFFRRVEERLRRRVSVLGMSAPENSSEGPEELNQLLDRVVQAWQRVRQESP